MKAQRVLCIYSLTRAITAPIQKVKKKVDDYVCFGLLHFFCLYHNSQFFGMFGLRFCVQVNSYGHVKTVSSPNQTFSWASLDILSLVIDNNPS